MCIQERERIPFQVKEIKTSIMLLPSGGYKQELGFPIKTENFIILQFISTLVFQILFCYYPRFQIAIWVLFILIVIVSAPSFTQLFYGLLYIKFRLILTNNDSPRIACTLNNKLVRQNTPVYVINSIPCGNGWYYVLTPNYPGNIVLCVNLIYQFFVFLMSVV